VSGPLLGIRRVLEQQAVHGLNLLLPRRFDGYPGACLKRIGMPISDLHDGPTSINWTLPPVKGLYRTLFTQLRADPGVDLDESNCLMDLRVFLQRTAQQDGVDVTHHAAWEAWLVNEVPVPCELHYARCRSHGDGHDGQCEIW
jgi:hypothetical protein